MISDVVIIGAGAAGLMCAVAAGQRQRKVILLEHTGKIAEKIRISGGGRCNFTNLHCSPDHYISSNPHFCTSALKRYSQHDFIHLVELHGIAYHEKTMGQLFCDNSAKDIIDMLVGDAQRAGVDIRVSTSVSNISKNTDRSFSVQTNVDTIETKSVVMACGGLSIPKIGATPFGYQVAEQFGLKVVPTRAGLVPLTFDSSMLDHTRDLSGLSVPSVQIRSESDKVFSEALLFTHRGVSGPSVLQISSYWQPGEDVTIDLNPGLDIFEWLKSKRRESPKAMLHTALSEILPKRLAQTIVDQCGNNGRMADLPDKMFKTISGRINSWTIKPSGSEGYRTAEVTLGGVDTQMISSKTFECKSVSGLYFIGEVLDVTGHLGGFNFQWAWSSGWCAGQYA